MLLKRKTFVNFGLSVLMVVMLAVAIPRLTAAQSDTSTTGNGLRITPIRQEMVLAPGQVDSYKIEVTNVSPGDINVVTVINDFASDNETGQPRLLTAEEGESPYSLTKFVVLPDDFLLRPGEKKEVEIKVEVPVNIAPGGYFGIVRFASGGNQDEQGNIALNASVGSILLVTVPGQVEEGMELGFIQARTGGVSRSLFEYTPDTLAINLINTGNSILKPFGRVAIKDMFGNEVMAFEFNGGKFRGNVLPKSSRTFEQELDDFGTIGRYTVEANISYGKGGGNIINAVYTFWIVPWRLIIGILAGILLVVWFATRGVKIYNRRIIEKAKKEI